MRPGDSIMYVKGVGEKKSQKYKKLNIETVEELLYHFPARYEDRTTVKRFDEIANDEKVCSYGTIVNFEKSTPKRNMTIIKVVVRQGNEGAFLTIFNNEYIKDKFNVGDKISFYGKAKKVFGRLEFNAPDIEKFGENNLTNMIYPVYNLTHGLTNPEIQKSLKDSLSKISFSEMEYVPLEFLEKHHICPLEYALKNIHFPATIDTLKIARFRLIYQEFFMLQLYLLMMKKFTQQHNTYRITPLSQLDLFISELPFELTLAQKKVIDEIKRDMDRDIPMQRLVQGDVGSGKTIVAFYSIYNAFLNGFQSTLMVPTEILAKQHYQSALDLFKNTGIRIRLLTGSTPKKEKEKIYKEISGHDCDFVIGTHAIIQDQVNFEKLALAITDEQHRFGVKQRNSLYSSYEIMPHVLVMTATPIPRTLSMIIQGDLDVSLIDEMPKGRKPIETIAIRKNLRKNAYDRCTEEIQKGRQVYIVCPLVEESEDLDIKSAQELFDELSQNQFSNYRVGLLHGKMKARDKAQIMEEFEDKKIEVLVSTTVIEVGINVPNATVMVIEDAQRFGLSQLHQLRGRVGRGTEESHCILIYQGNSDILKQRMKIMTETNNGFVISEKDLILRGPGEMFGLRQHGLPEFKIADLVKHMNILHRAQEDARILIDDESSHTSAEKDKVMQRVKVKFEKEIKTIALN
ncbi:ATP-dependent DNA helicase RecG [Proteocatella sphenisci]|uniref:ATP-dependent DNA helicase RecG n=1 Tax=Proteocatella sphenisci TaxID=181070 RepID=UPI00049067FB|nr:ATP-dependent DNA helicase RecG [Proteocatella sphenisci]